MPRKAPERMTRAELQEALAAADKRYAALESSYEAELEAHRETLNDLSEAEQELSNPQSDTPTCMREWATDLIEGVACTVYGLEALKAAIVEHEAKGLRDRRATA